MIAELEHRRAEIAEICRRYGVLRLDVFGSAATGSFDPARSDIDFIVEYPEGYDLGRWFVRYFDLKEELQGLLGRTVDVVRTTAPNNPTFWNDANASRETIYDATRIPAVAG